MFRKEWLDLIIEDHQSLLQKLMIIYSEVETEWKFIPSYKKNSM